LGEVVIIIFSLFFPLPHFSVELVGWLIPFDFPIFLAFIESCRGSGIGVFVCFSWSKDVTGVRNN
jgi:hypothetical protein